MNGFHRDESPTLNRRTVIDDGKASWPVGSMGSVARNIEGDQISLLGLAGAFKPNPTVAPEMSLRQGF